MPENFIALMRSLKAMYEDFIVKYDQWMGIDSVGLDGKVDKIAGKGLSENDYTTTDKNKLAGIESGANKYEHPATHPVAIIDGKLYPMQFVKTDANGNTGWGHVSWSEIVGKPADQDNVEFTTYKGMPNGYCPLGSDGKIDPSFINSINAFDTFFPADIASMLLLNAGLGDFAFIPVGVDGEGNTVYDTYQLGALPASTQANWKKINIVGVSSINGEQGVVVLGTDDINEGIGNLYFTNERVDDRVAAILNGGTNITVTYDDATGAITISANDTSVEWSEIQNKPTTLAGYGVVDSYTKTETDTNIATAIAALVDASPTTLDTLNELAAALGDDPNFATTITNMIALKAPLAEPTFTGYIGLPKWTTLTRPILSSDQRATGFNTDTGTEETWNGTGWVAAGSNLISTTTIGTPGALGFGVGIANGSLAAAMGLYPMPGYNDVTSENYGNYIDLHGSVMVFVPKFYHKITNDIAAPYYGTKVEVSDTEAAGFVINRAFVNNGSIQDGFFIDKYLCGNVGGKFVGMRGIDPVSTAADHNPIASITGVTLGNRYAAIFQAVKSRGAGYAVPSMFMYNAIALLTLAHAQAATPATAAWMDVAPYAPKGCNNDNLGDTNDISIKYVSAGNATYPKAPLNASCSDTAFAKITHNGQKCGITDLNGNMWEIASGFIQSTADAFWTLKTTIDIKNLTGVVVTDATDNWNTANYDALTLPFTPNETQTTFGNGTSAVFSGNTDTASNAYRLDAVGVPLSMGGAPARFGGDGLWQYSTASMCPIVGGDWGNASAAGVWARAWIHARSATNNNVGGRACLIGA